MKKIVLAFIPVITVLVILAFIVRGPLFGLGCLYFAIVGFSLALVAIRGSLDGDNA